MKVLVGAACIVVIACGGLYLFTQWAAYSDAKERAAGRERARAEIFRLAAAQPHQDGKVKEWCRMTVSVAPEVNSPLTTEWARKSTALGYAY
jgi:hypothetical protein